MPMLITRTNRPTPFVCKARATSCPIINGHISLDSVDFFRITVARRLICCQHPYLWLLWFNYSLIACRAEAVKVDMTNHMASQPAWSQPEHFMMQLHPGNMPSRGDHMRRSLFCLALKWTWLQLKKFVDLNAVPLSKIYANYLAYLLKHMRSYLAHVFGYDVWLELERWEPASQ